MESQRTGQVTVLALGGQLTTERDAARLQQAIADLLAAGDRHLVLNLARLRRIDRFGLDGLLRSHRMTALAGGDLTLVGLHRRIRARMLVAGLLRVFDVHDTAPGGGMSGLICFDPKGRTRDTPDPRDPRDPRDNDDTC